MSPVPSVSARRSLPWTYRLLRGALRLFFHLLYQPFAWAYDGVAALVSVGRWKRWVLSALPRLDGPRLLELGHGPGHLQAALGRKGLQPFGLDRSPQMGRLAFRRLQHNLLAPHLVNGEAQHLPFATASFDQVVATFPTEYIVDALTLAEVRRVLAPRGELLILPVAWITGGSLPERAAAGLFRITGQAPQWDESALAPLQRAGFDATTEIVSLGGSQALLIHARPVY